MCDSATQFTLNKEYMKINEIYQAVFWISKNTIHNVSCQWDLFVFVNKCVPKEFRNNLHFRAIIVVLKLLFNLNLHLSHHFFSNVINYTQAHIQYQQISKSWSSRIDRIFSSIKCKGSSGHETHIPASKAYWNAK